MGKVRAIRRAREYLTPKMSAFVNAYVLCNNATQAAREAGYTADPRVTGGKLLHTPAVITAIDKARDLVAKEACITKADVIRELGRIAMFDIAKLYNEDGSIKQIYEVDEDTRRALLEHNITMDEFGQRSLKTLNAGKVRALELLAKHFGMLEQKYTPPAATLNIDINFGEAQPPIVIKAKPLDGVVPALTPPREPPMIEMDSDNTGMDAEDDDGSFE